MDSITGYLHWLFDGLLQPDVGTWAVTHGIQVAHLSAWMLLTYVVARSILEERRSNVFFKATARLAATGSPPLHRTLTRAGYIDRDRALDPWLRALPELEVLIRRHGDALGRNAASS